MDILTVKCAPSLSHSRRTMIGLTLCGSSIARQNSVARTTWDIKNYIHLLRTSGAQHVVPLYVCTRSRLLTGTALLPNTKPLICPHCSTMSTVQAKHSASPSSNAAVASVPSSRTPANTPRGTHVRFWWPKQLDSQSSRTVLGLNRR